MAVAAAGAAVIALVVPAVATALPTGSAGSSDLGGAVVDFGSSVVDFGSSVLDGGSSILNSGSFAPTQQCNGSTQSGGEGVTDTRHELGRSGPTSFVLNYETLSVPDQIDVFYEGNRIHSTGYVGDDLNEGTGSAVIAVPAGGATAVLVRVTGPSGTAWEYVVNCPVL